MTDKSEMLKELNDKLKFLNEFAGDHSWSHHKLLILSRLDALEKLAENQAALMEQLIVLEQKHSQAAEGFKEFNEKLSKQQERMIKLEMTVMRFTVYLSVTMTIVSNFAVFGKDLLLKFLGQ